MYAWSVYELRPNLLRYFTLAGKKWSGDLTRAYSLSSVLKTTDSKAVFALTTQVESGLKSNPTYPC